MIFRCTNINDISKIINHPKVYRMASDDLSPNPYIPDMQRAFYLMNKEKTGVVPVFHVNGIACQVHIAALPELWGKAGEFIKEAFTWGFKHTKYQKIFAFIPVYNRLTIRLVKKGGMVKEGCLKKSFLKGWKLYDQEVFGLIKKDFLKGE